MQDKGHTATADRAQRTVDTAKEKAGNVAGTMTEEVSNVAEKAKSQARNALDQFQSDARTRANEEASKVAGTLHDTSGQLRSMAEATTENSLAATLAQEGANAAERLASRLDDGGVEAIVADIRSYARRNPGSFLVGAAAVGFVAGRIVRNASGSPSADDADARAAEGVVW